MEQQQQRPNDKDLIDEAGELPTPSAQGSAGGDLSREIGQRDEARNAGGGDPEGTRVQGKDKPADGDLPTPPETRE